MKNRLLQGFALLGVLTLLTACGTRPSRLTPPSGPGAEKLFPGKYPNIKTIDDGVPPPTPVPPVTPLPTVTLPTDPAAPTTGHVDTSPATPSNTP